MTDALLIVVAVFTAGNSLLGVLLLLRTRQINVPLTKDDALQLLRGETDLIRKSGDDQARGIRQELSDNLKGFQDTTINSFRVLSEQQKERLEQTTAALSTLTEKHERSQESLRQSVEGRLDAIRQENATKLDEMRQTVDEKLQSTLETRLGESFNRVVEQLARVHEGLGEMKNLASNVGDLKNVLTNVKVRGTFGEVQLELCWSSSLRQTNMSRTHA